MSGAVGSPFTASMFRFDDLRILVVFIHVNTLSILLWRDYPIYMNTLNIYFSLDRVGHQEGRALRITGTKNPARWLLICYLLSLASLADGNKPLIIPRNAANIFSVTAVVIAIITSSGKMV